VDQDRFDAWTRRIASRSHRRAAAKLLTGGALGAVFAAFGLTAATAGPDCGADGAPCKKKTDCCSGACKRKKGKKKGKCQPCQAACCRDADCTGGKRCQGGTCTCPDGQVDCAGTCRQCCGDGHCTGGKTCQGGNCACPSGKHDCAGTCMNCCNDADCGGNACTAGTCGPCPRGYRYCAEIPGCLEINEAYCCHQHECISGSVCCAGFGNPICVPGLDCF
jgi:hypothetical protein